MIISHKHRYLFIENPLTGSWAIHLELCNHYEGTPILHKHATYAEFEREVGEVSDEYFVFATVRNPLDKIASAYAKLKTDHKGAFSSANSTDKLKVDFVDRRKYRFIQENNASFSAYFRKFYRRPYSDMLDLSAQSLDYVIRFENLQQDFAELLRRLNIQQVQPVPVRNKTRGKKETWRDYYTPEIIPQAKKTTGPYMTRWGYSFPPEWGVYVPSRLQDAEYKFHLALRLIYNRQFRYNNSAYARAIRSLRARLAG
jgi:hypothetical protein